MYHLCPPISRAASHHASTQTGYFLSYCTLTHRLHIYPHTGKPPYLAVHQPQPIREPAYKPAISACLAALGPSHSANEPVSRAGCVLPAPASSSDSSGGAPSTATSSSPSSPPTQYTHLYVATPITLHAHSPIYIAPPSRQPASSETAPPPLPRSPSQCKTPPPETAKTALHT